MLMKRIIKSSLVSLAVLGMIGGSMNSTIANVKHRHIHYTRQIKRTKHSHKRSRLYRHRVWLYGRGKITPHYKYVYTHGRRKGVAHKHAHHYNKHGHKRYIKHSHGFHFNPRLDGESKSDREYDEVVYHKDYDPTIKQVDKIDGGYLSMNSKKYGQIKDKLEQPDINAYNNEERNNTKRENAKTKFRIFYDLNKDREENGVAPLTESSELDAIAHMRAQPSQNQNHTDPNTDNVYAKENASKLGYDDPSNSVYGENLGTSNSNSSNGKQIADVYNNDMMNHDADSNLGHRENILNPNYSSFGIGVFNDNIVKDFK